METEGSTEKMWRRRQSAARAPGVVFRVSRNADKKVGIGIAAVRLPNGALRRAELHWYEAHGMGRRVKPGRVNKSAALPTNQGSGTGQPSEGGSCRSRGGSRVLSGKDKLPVVEVGWAIGEPQQW